MKIWKFSGALLTATGILHTLVTALLTKEIFVAIIRDGVVDTIKEDYVRGFALWFLVCGVLLILWGETLQHYIRKSQRPAPLFLGYSMLLFAVLGGIIVPVSGFWLFLPQGLIIVLANKRLAKDRA